MHSVPGFQQLAAMPDVLRGLLAHVSDEVTGWKPAPNRWSVQEVLGHLAHVEVHGFRQRVERMLAEDNPSLENYDPDAFLAQGAYHFGACGEALQLFGLERVRSLDLLRSLAPEALARTGVHAALGPVTIGNLVHEWPFHDLGHLRQIAEILRARLFYPHMGAWQKFYTVAP
jgi:hypothetical protein